MFTEPHGLISEMSFRLILILKYLIVSSFRFFVPLVFLNNQNGIRNSHNHIFLV